MYLVNLDGQTHIGLCRNDNLLPRFVFCAFRDWERSVSWKGVGMQKEFIGFRIPGSGIRDPSFGFQISGSGFRVSGFGFQISGSGIRDPGFKLRVSGFWFLVSVVGCRVYLAARRAAAPDCSEAMRPRSDAFRATRPSCAPVQSVSSHRQC